MPAVKRKRLEVMFIQEKKILEIRERLEKNPKSPGGADVSQKMTGLRSREGVWFPVLCSAPGAPCRGWAPRGCPDPCGDSRGTSGRGEIPGKCQLGTPRVGRKAVPAAGLGWQGARRVPAGCPQPAPEELRAAPRLGCVGMRLFFRVKSSFTCASHL